MNYLLTVLLAIVVMVACGPSGLQISFPDHDEVEYVNNGENEPDNIDDVYEDDYEEEYDFEYVGEYEDMHNGTEYEYENEYEDIHNGTEEEGGHVDSEENEPNNNDDEYEEESEGEYEDEHEGTEEEEEEGYVELPDWMDVDLDQLSPEKLSLLTSAGNQTQMMKIFGLNQELQDQLNREAESHLKHQGSVEVGVRSLGPSVQGNEIVVEAEHPGCAPELELVKLESPPDIQYFPQCVRLPRCGGCCTNSHLSCQSTRNETINLKVMVLKNKRRSRRSTEIRSNRSKRKSRVARMKFAIVDQVKHLDCSCQCRIKEHHCDSSIQVYKESECACVCKNKDKEAECVAKGNHYWDHKTCSCFCKNQRECSTGEEFSQETCSCVNSIGSRTIQNINACDSYCVKGNPLECSCNKGWKGKRCDIPICETECVKGRCVSPNTCQCQQGWDGDQCQNPICDPGCVHGKCVLPNKCRCLKGWRGKQCQKKRRE